MADDATLAAAPAPAGQPASQAVSADPAPVVTPQATAQLAAQPAAEPVQATPVATQTPDELDTLRKRYADSSQEALRLYRENQELKTKATQPAATQPTYTPEQLETWKEQWLVQSAKAAASGDDNKALEAARQIRMIDAELRKSEITAYSNQQSAGQAYQSLSAEVQPILAKYQADLVPGTAVRQSADAFYQQAVMAGAAPNAVTATAAALLALEKAGKFNGSTVKASQQATQHLNQAIKTAAAAGSGAANTNAAAAPNIAGMSTAEFKAYRKSIGVGT